MQLIPSRAAQYYNRTKNRKGAYWEDRYHATAVDADEYLARSSFMQLAGSDRRFFLTYPEEDSIECRHDQQGQEGGKTQAEHDGYRHGDEEGISHQR